MVVAEGLCGDTQITAEGPHYADFCTIETELFRTRVRIPPLPPMQYRARLSQAARYFAISGLEP